MFDISNNGIVKLNRGDTFHVPYFINSNTDLNPIRYALKDGDKLYFALMEPNQPFEQAILKQVYDSSSEKTNDGDIILKINQEDTEMLLPGKYYYTFKLRLADGTVCTTTPMKEFWLIE